MKERNLPMWERETTIHESGSVTGGQRETWANRESGSVKGGEVMNHHRPWWWRMQRRWRKPPSQSGARRRRPRHSARCRSTWREWTAWRASRQGAPPWRRACAATAAICWTLRCWYLREKEKFMDLKRKKKNKDTNTEQVMDLERTKKKEV